MVRIFDQTEIGAAWLCDNTEFMNLPLEETELFLSSLVLNLRSARLSAGQQTTTIPAEVPGNENVKPEKAEKKGKKKDFPATGERFLRERPGGKIGNQAKRRFLMDFPVSASVWRASGSAPAIKAARSRTMFWRMRATRSRPSWVMATMILRRSLAALMRFR